MFARFLATSGRSDFSIALIVGYGLRPSRQRPGHDWRGRRWRSPGSRAKGFCACQGLRRRGVGMCLAISTPAVLPSVGRKTSAPRTCLTPLNTSPAPSPVNASRLPSRTTRASLGAGTVRYSFTVTDFHRLPFAGLPAHPSTASKPEVACLKGIPHHALVGIAGGDAGELALKGGSGGPAVQPFLLRRQERGVACLLMRSSYFNSLSFEAAGSLICLNTRLALDVGVVRTGKLAARKRDEHGRVLAVQAILVPELLDQIVLF